MLIINILGMASAGAIVSLLAVAVKSGGKVDQLIKALEKQARLTPRMEVILAGEKAKQIMFGISGASLAFYLIACITCILVLVVACSQDDRAKGRKNLLVPWMIWQILWMVIVVGFFIWQAVVYGLKDPNVMFSGGMYVVYILIGIYCLVMMYSYFQYLRDYEPLSDSHQM
jgi:hypothetical protein